MKSKIKSLVGGEVRRLESSGEIKEIFLKEDFLNPKEILVDVCFRGENSSGIMELTGEEVEMIRKEFVAKKKLLGKVKVMKFKK